MPAILSHITRAGSSRNCGGVRRGGPDIEFAIADEVFETEVRSRLFRTS